MKIDERSELVRDGRRVTDRAASSLIGRYLSNTGK